MKRLIHIFLSTLVFLFISCNPVKEERSIEKSHALIDTSRTNTYAFLGNSITHDGRYHSYFELFLLTRYPDVDFQFVNAGVAGDQAGIALERLQDDLLVHQPDLVMVMFGMNDIGRNLYGRENLEVDSLIVKQQRNLSNYSTNLDSMTRLLLDAGTKVVLFTPSIYEQNADNLAAPNRFGCNDALGKCALMVEKIKREYNTYLVDHFSVMDSLNKLLQKDNPDTTIVGPDRVHPQDAGHFIMAHNIIRQLEYKSLVASVEINIPEKRISVTNAKVEDLRIDEGETAFNYKPGALPFPTKNYIDIAALISFNQKMNKESITIKGLSAGNYAMHIDTMELAGFTDKELEAGINLSTYVTPQHLYAAEIANLVEQKRKLYSNKLRNIAFIEYFFAPEVRELNDNQQVINILQNRSKTANNDWISSQIERYFEVKNNLPAIENEIDSLNVEINKLRQAIPAFKIIVKKI